MLGDLKVYIKNRIRSFGFRLFPELWVIQPQGDNHYNLRNYVSGEVNISPKAIVYPLYWISNSSIGDYTYISRNSVVNMTEIGKFCSIGPNLLCGWGIHPTNGISTSPMFYSVLKQNGMTLCDKDKVEEQKPIKIGNDVFIGANVTILDGVTIGDGAVIGAGAVVSKDIPSYAVAVGSPIRILRYRFNEEIRSRLLITKWWDFDVEKLKDVEKFFFDVEAFIEKNMNK